MRFFTTHLVGANWTDANQPSHGNTALKGTVYLDNQAIDAQSFARHLERANDAPSAMALLQSLNGFYSWVEQTPTALRAGVDHIRSRPLFYGKKANHFYLSDDAVWVRQQVGEDEMDPVAREEFLLTGYVTGSDTLFATIKQLQAGEYLLATQSETGIKISTHRFYRFLHTEPTQFDEVKGFEALDQVALGSIQRLVDHAKGRQIVVPLSGGYDSRLIVTLLKRLNYQNILTFTYGTPGNKESKYSKHVADALGLRWHFVEYNAQLWREAWQTSERWDYQQMAAGWSCLAHVQDWLAVKIMKNQGVLEKDCLFAPGHSGDFVAGSHIPDRAQKGITADFEDMLESVFSVHYALAPFHSTSSRPKKFWQARILERTEATHVTDGVSLADAFEKWDWQERQAKFICNSVRVYEFFGYDWWLPLWDCEFMRFWETIPLNLRKGRVWYLKYVSAQFNGQSIKAIPNLGNAGDGSKYKQMARKVFKGNLFNLAKKVHATLPLLKVIKKTPLAEQSHYLLSGSDTQKVRKLEKENYSVVGAYALINSLELDKYLKRNDQNF